MGNTFPYAVLKAMSFEKLGVTFESVHEQEARTVALEAAAAGVKRLVLVSGIGADSGSKSPYVWARGRGDLAVRRAFPSATIVRPSAMFGPGDALFGTLADIVRLLADRGTAGQTYELAGPGVYTLRELVGCARPGRTKAKDELGGRLK